MEELITEIRLLRMELAAFRTAYENRPRNSYSVKKQAEQLLEGLTPLQKTVAQFVLNRMEWLIHNDKTPNFNAAFIANTLNKTTDLRTNEEEVKLSLVQLIDKKLINIERQYGNEDWKWVYGERVNAVVDKLNEGDRAAFFKAFYYRKKD